MAKRRGRSGSRLPMRRGKKIVLHLRADQAIDYKDLELISKCVGSQGQIFSRRRTSLNAKMQREMKVAIKRARHLALLPFVGN